MCSNRLIRHAPDARVNPASPLVMLKLGRWSLLWEVGIRMRIISYVTAVLAVAGFATTQSLASQGGRASVAPANLQLVEDLVVANRILANEGILDGLGHVSVRHDQRPDRFLLSRDMAPGLVTAEDLMEFDLDGNPVDPQGRQLYAERFIHSAIYRARPERQVGGPLPYPLSPPFHRLQRPVAADVQPECLSVGRGADL